MKMSKEVLVLTGYEVLREQVKDELKAYVPTPATTPEDYKVLKTNRAELNKLSKKVDDERKRLTKELKKEIDDIVNIIDGVSLQYDIEAKNWEEKLKELRKKEIELYFITQLKTAVKLEDIFEERWLNATCDWQKELAEKIERVENDIAVIKMIIPDNEELINIYKEVGSVVEAKKIYDESQPETLKTITVTMTGGSRSIDKLLEYAKSLDIKID